MNKLALRLDDLVVESFATTQPDGRVGTVRGHEVTPACGTVTRYVSCNFTACPLDC
jgi:hypothetical protein